MAPGAACSSAPSPKPIASNITTKPITTPSMCGSDRANPKFVPEAITIRLLGPGVTDDTKAKSVRASRVWGVSIPQQ
jgi:hypothetical protein